MHYGQCDNDELTEYCAKSGESRKRRAYFLARYRQEVSVTTPPPPPPNHGVDVRLSNHKLAIETGRYSRPFKKPEGRICPICKIEMEDEYHFLNICPA